STAGLWSACLRQPRTTALRGARKQGVAMADFAQRQRWLPVILTAVLAGIFAADLAAPPGVAVWLFYLVPLFATYWLADARLPLVFAGLATALTLLAVALSPHAAVSERDVLNRCLGIVITWVVAVLVRGARQA